MKMPSTRQGQKMQSLVYEILYVLSDFGFKTFWVNAEHMIADGLTKISSASRIDLIQNVMEESKVRITYCTVSGRLEKQELLQLKPMARRAGRACNLQAILKLGL